MKVALLKIGARISNGDLKKMSSTLSEVLATKKLLTKIGCDIDIYSKNPKNEDGIYDLEIYHDLVNDRGYDALVVVNGSMPMYGGIDGGDDIYNHKIIAAFKGPIIYMLYDPYLGLKDMSANIAKKEIYAHHSDSIKHNNTKLHYITQCRNTSGINELGQKSITYFPLEQFPLFMPEIYDVPSNREHNKIDLAYCGSFRGGRRQKDMIHFFFDTGLKTELTGNIKLQQFNQNWISGKTPPTINKPLKQAEVAEYMGDVLASVVIADPIYKQHYDIAQRAYENLIYGVVNFIDLTVDPNREFYEDEFMKDYMYIATRQSLVQKINEIKNDKALYDKIISKQNEIIRNFNFEEYIANFKQLFETLVERG